MHLASWENRESIQSLSQNRQPRRRLKTSWGECPMVAWSLSVRPQSSRRNNLHHEQSSPLFHKWFLKEKRSNKRWCTFSNFAKVVFFRSPNTGTRESKVIIFVGWTQWKKRKLYFSYETIVEKNSHCPRSLEKFFWGYLPRLRGCRPFVVLSPAWKVLRFLALRNFPARPVLFELRIWLVGTVGSQRPVLILVFPGCMCRFFPSAGRAGQL